MTRAMKNRGSYRSDEQRQPPPVRQHKAEVHPQQRQRYRLLNFRECGCRFEPRDRYRCKPYQLTRRSPLPKEWFHIAANKADSIRMAHTMTASKKSRRRLPYGEYGAVHAWAFLLHIPDEICKTAETDEHICPYQHIASVCRRIRIILGTG